MTENLYQNNDPVLRQSLKGLQGAEIYSRTRKLSRIIQLDKQNSSEQVTAFHREEQILTPLSLTAIANTKAHWIQKTWVSGYIHKAKEIKIWENIISIVLLVLCGFNQESPLAPADTAHALKDRLQLQEHGYADFFPSSQSMTSLLKKKIKLKEG